MRCPVCNHMISIGKQHCENCGFTEADKVFINQQEAELWLQETVLPYRERYIQNTGDLHALRLNAHQIGTAEATQSFQKRLQQLLTQNGTLLAPIDIDRSGRTFSPVFLSPVPDVAFVAIYSGVQSSSCPNHPTTAGIKANVLMDYILGPAPEAQGLIVDPYDKPMYIVKKQLEEWLLPDY